MSRTPRWRSLTLRDVGPLRAGIAAAVVVCALLAAWARVAAAALGGRLQRSARAGGARPHRRARRRAHRGQPRPALRRSAAHARRRPGGRRPVGRRRRHLRAAPCTCSPSNFKTWQALGEYDLRSGQPAGGAAGAARRRLPQPRGRRPPRGASPKTANCSRSRTPTCRRCAPPPAAVARRRRRHIDQTGHLGGSALSERAALPAVH